MNNKKPIWKKFYELIKDMFTRYYEHNVGNSAAALTYYLIFSFFPFLIFSSNLLGMLNLPPLPVDELQRFIPQDVLDIFNNYLVHVTANQSPQLLLFGLVFSVYFPMRAVHSLMDYISLAYDEPSEVHPVKRTILDLVFTIGLIAVIIIAVIIVIIGPSLLIWIANFLPISLTHINLWGFLRFIILGGMMLFNLGTLYFFAPAIKITIKSVIPGAIGALLFWMAYSIGFSFYVENMGNYSALYGSIGAIIVLLIWLYFTSVTLILGAEFNASIRKYWKNDNAIK